MGAFRHISFLVIDDNRHMASIVRVLLRAFGAEAIHECYRLAEAFAEFRGRASDIVIVDTSTPADGLDFIRRARRDPASPNAAVPILLLTAHSERRRLIEARDAGVTELLVKPLMAYDLFSRLDAMIHRPRPFIDTPGYVGPCRRRHADPKYRGIERRHTDAVAAAEDAERKISG